MKRRNVFLTIMQTFLLAIFAHAQARQVTITISTSQTEVKAGVPVNLEIVLANLSQQDIHIFRAPGHEHAELFYSISVCRGDGSAAPMTTYDDAINNRGARPISKIMTTIKPGEKLKEYATISDIFDMTVAGKYEIVVKRPDPLDPRVLIRSNRISIDVIN